jgi:hypothetical protein
MGKSRLTDFTGQEIRPGAVGVYPSRQGNRVRNSEAVVLETKSSRAGGRVRPILVVQPTGRDSGFIQRKTRRTVRVSSEHFAVTGYTDAA